MKYAITHCYTDQNKGDAAIIIATTQLLREVDPTAQVNFYSTFGPRDKRLRTDHDMIRPYGDQLYPGLFYQPEPLPVLTHDSLRGVSFLFILFKAFLLLVSARPAFLRFILSNHEVEGVKEFLSSDVMISKGGSYLTTENTSLRQSLSLFALLYPFIFARRYKKRAVIFSQSLGPVKGKFNQWLFRKALEGVDRIYLREKLCLEKYAVVREVCDNVDTRIIPDTAFYLKDDRRIEPPVYIDRGRFNVGYTLVDHDYKYLSGDLERQERRANYKKCIIDSMNHLLRQKDAMIHIFPQVLVGNSHLGHNDLRISREVVAHFAGGEFEDRVRCYDADYTPNQLRCMYGQMELFVGTRLHSVIFALSMCVPSINISYHGTKSRGILNGITGFSQYVIDIDSICPEELTVAIDDLCASRSHIREKLSESMLSMRSSLTTAMLDVCVMAGAGN